MICLFSKICIVWAMPKWNNRVCSIKFSQWDHFIKLSQYLYEITTDGDRVGSEWRGREIERKQWINGVRDGALDRNGNGVGQKWPLVKMDTWVFLVMQINRTIKLSIKLGGSRILQFHWCRNICSHDDMFRHLYAFVI